MQSDRWGSHRDCAPGCGRILDTLRGWGNGRVTGADGNEFCHHPVQRYWNTATECNVILPPAGRGNAQHHPRRRRAVCLLKGNWRLAGNTSSVDMLPTRINCRSPLSDRSVPVNTTLLNSCAMPWREVESSFGSACLCGGPSPTHSSPQYARA
jgi:hypothetical protein